MKNEKIIDFFETETGFTDNPNEAIYMLRDGKLVSGGYELGVRGEDHNIVESLINMNSSTDHRFWSIFHNETGMLRLVPETKKILLMDGQMLTEEQKQMLQQFDEYSIEIYCPAIPVENSEQPRFFIDLDGTEAHFNNSIESLDVLHEKGYYRHLVPQQNVVDAVNVLIDKYPNQVFILSAVLNSPYAAEDKKAWVKEFNPNLPDNQLILCPYGEPKQNYVPGGIKQSDVLLDDYTNNLIAWQKAGGQSLKLINGINHTNRTWEGSSVHYLDNELSKKIEHFSSGNEIKEFLDQEVSVLSISIHYQKDDFESIKDKLKELNALFANVLKDPNNNIEIRVSLSRDGIDILKNERIDYEHLVSHEKSIYSNQDFSLVEILKDRAKANILMHRNPEVELNKFRKLEELFEQMSQTTIIEESVVIGI